MTLESVSFEGHDCVRLADGDAVVFVTTSVGPRVLGLVVESGNLLATLPHAVLERPGGEPYRLVGGHRLWAAPEIPEITYQPDDARCEATEVRGGVRVEAPPDGAGLVKSIEIRRTNEGWDVDHVLRNASGTPLDIAPWAVTQLRLGGEAFIPAAAAGEGPQADRSLVLWPYTDLGDRRIAFAGDELRLAAVPAGPPLKLGVAPSEGRVSYRLEGNVFEKRIDVEPGAPYADRGAAIQVYLCDEFCELETLGPLRPVEPDGSATHRERWILRRERPDGVENPEP